jgi:flagellar protein FlaG
VTGLLEPFMRETHYINQKYKYREKFLFFHTEVDTMGIEAVKGAAGAQNYQSQAVAHTKPVENVSKVSTNSSDAVNITSDYSTQVVGKTNEGSTKNGDSQSKSKSQDDNNTNTQRQMPDIKEINKLINRNTVAEFGYNEPTHRVTITIKDKETDEVIKEIPSDKALKMIAKAWELAGLLVDERR